MVYDTDDLRLIRIKTDASDITHTYIFTACSYYLIHPWAA